MWENQTKQEIQQLYPPTKEIVRKAKQNADAVLITQCVMCLLLLSFVLLMRSIDTQAVQEMRTSCEQLMTQGIQYGDDTQFARMANAGIKALREKTDAFLSEIEEKPTANAGGFWPVKNKKKVPDGASLKDYTLPDAIQLPIKGAITSAFGFRDNPVNGTADFHMGVDFAADKGEEIASVLSGQVVKTGTGELRGNYIVVRHRSGLQTLYQHLTCSYVRVGELVAQGQTIGTAGDTGFVTGPHLHFELILDGVRVDPMQALSAVK